MEVEEMHARNDVVMKQANNITELTILVLYHLGYLTPSKTL